MEMGFLEILGIVLITALFVGVAGVVVASIAKSTLRQLRGGREDATDEVLDRLDQMEIRLSAMSERLRSGEVPAVGDGSGEEEQEEG